MSVVLHINGKAVTLEDVERKGQEISFRLGKTSYRFSGQRLEGLNILEQEEIAGVYRRVPVVVSAAGKAGRRVQIGAVEASISEAQTSAAAHGQAAALSPLTPMPGVVRQVMVKPKDKVKKGQALAILEAMKLQLTLAAGGDGVVEAVLAQPGQMVAEGIELVKLKAL